ncbi:MAG: carbohydrate ABC transporter permease [bacterium]
MGIIFKPLTQSQREEIGGYLFISPWIIGLLAFWLGPMAISLGLSFFKADLMTPARFVGFDNYRRLFSTDPVQSLFWKSLWNTAYYTFLSVPLHIVFGLTIALLLNQKIKGVGAFRTIYYLPAVITGAAVALLWMMILDPEFGLLNYVLSILHLPRTRWIASERWVKPAFIIMSLWGVGGSMLIYLAGLQGIPTQLYEAAKIDGANAWQVFWRITIPMLSPTIFFTLVTGIIGTFQVFTASYIMTGGGPNNATLFYVLYLYKLAFEEFKMGFACSLAWVYFIIIMGLTALIFRSSAAWVYYETEILKGGRR